jgi:cell division septal protein FtsQ
LKFKNRRRKRNEYLLDVKVRTEGRMSNRMRWLAAVLTAVTVVGLTSYGVVRAVKWTAGKLVFENPRFAVREIAVENDGGMTPAQVIQLAGARPGVNVFSVDLAQLRRNLELIPMVRAVDVRRVLPGKLVIHVNERIAVAKLQGPGRELRDSAFWIDRQGVVMKPVKVGDAILQPQTVGPVPLLTGVTLADVRVGRKAESDQVYDALELIDRLAQSAAGSLVEVEQVDLSRPRQLLVTTKQKTVVKFDVKNFQQQLRRLSTILVWAMQRQKPVQLVDLTVERGVPVAFAN